MTIVSIAQTDTAPAADEVVRGDLGAKINEYLTRLEAFGFSGTLLVENKGEVILHKGYGLANRAEKIPVNTSMIFNIGSLGKQFTAAAILKLEMQGKLSTDDTLGRFFPDAPDDKKGITLHQLLTHTSGLPYLWSGGMFAPATREQVIGEILALPLESNPGERHAYSNPGYSLLARVIENVSGMSYADYLRGNIFEPAGMARTGFEGDSDRWDNGLIVHSYSDSQDEGALKNFPTSEKAIGAGTIISTVGDLYKWEQALRGTGILSESAKEKFFAPHVPVQGPLSYGYGWNVGPTPRKTRVIFHGGDIGGYNAEHRRYPDEHITVIFTSNARTNGAGYRQAVMNNLIFMITGSSYPQPPAVTRIDTTLLQRYSGTYELGSGGKLLAWVENSRLMLGADGAETIALLAGADPGDAKMNAMRNDLSERTGRVIAGIRENNMEPLREHLHPSLPFEDTKDQARSSWEWYQDRFGAFKGQEVIGTAIMSQVSARTFVRLIFERGEVIDMYAWVGGKIASIEGEIERPMATPFLPESENRFSNFDMFTGKTMRATFDLQKDGKVTGVVLQTQTGEASAKKKG